MPSSSKANETEPYLGSSASNRTKYLKALPVLQNCIGARARHSFFRNIVSIRAWSLPSRETDQPAVRNARALFTSEADRTAKAALSTARGRTAYAEQTFDLQGFLPTLRLTYVSQKERKKTSLRPRTVTQKCCACALARPPYVEN